MFLMTSLVPVASGGFPHAGGDVSTVYATASEDTPFSPRRWGCFYMNERNKALTKVFPTQVGMFPKFMKNFSFSDCFPHAGGDVSHAPKTSALKRLGFPHAGGDVSTWHQAGPACGMFSPRRWGCF